MLNLSNVTLLCVETREPELAHWAIDRCLSTTQFAKVVLITNLDRISAKRASIEYVQAPPIKTTKDYSELLLTGINQYIDSSHVLVIQWDSFVIHPQLWSDEFLQYDYLGAPIWNNEVGCGGFSLRSKKFCEASAKLDLSVRNYPLMQRRGIREKDYSNEDSILCIERRTELEAMGIRFAPAGLASRFAWSYEGGRGMYNGAFGFHSPESMRILQTIGIIS